MTTIDGDVQINGALIVTDDFAAPDGSIGDADIEAAAEIDQTKQAHRLNITYSQQVGVNGASDARVLYRCYPAGGATILKFGAGCTTLAGAATTMTIDLRKNGTTVLTATFALDNTNTIYVQEDAPGFTSTALAQGDILTAHLTLAGANPPQGVWVNLIVKEKGV